MGGLFRAPKPKAVEPPAPPAQAETVAQSAARTEAAAETAQADARVQAISRARRGIAGTIVTSPRGVLDPLPPFAARKNLLGE